MKYAILVHYQFMQDDGKLLEEKISKYNSLASLVPNLFDISMKFQSGEAIFERLHPTNNYYSKKSKESLGKSINKLNIPVFVEGYRHCCEPCFKEGRDPYHEYVCANGNAQEFYAQEENTKKGIDLIKKNLGDKIEIAGLCSPNHQGNGDTRNVARQLGLKNYVVRRGFDYPKLPFDLPAWDEDGLIILPESKIAGKAPLCYIMYSNVVEKGWEAYEHIFANSVPLSEIEIEKKRQNLAKWSEWLVWKAKRIRDRKKGF